jgi:DedD protein
MERATQERLVGAVILVFAVIAIVPAILTGPKPPPGTPSRETAMKSLEIELAPATPPSDALVPEPERSPARAAASGEGVPAAPTGLPTKEAPAAAPPEGAGAAPRPLATTVPPAPGSPAAAAAPPREAVMAPDASLAWAVQLGAFSTAKSADKLVKDLQGRGYPAFIVEYRAEGRVLYRVRVGPEQDRGRADALAARLAKDGYKGNVARHP